LAPNQEELLVMPSFTNKVQGYAEPTTGLGSLGNHAQGA